LKALTLVGAFCFWLKIYDNQKNIEYSLLWNLLRDLHQKVKPENPKGIMEKLPSYIAQ
jgi:hypothetical protein